MTAPSGGHALYGELKPAQDQRRPRVCVFGTASYLLQRQRRKADHDEPNYIVSGNCGYYSRTPKKKANGSFDG